MLTIVERASRRAARRERWNIAERALEQIEANQEEGESAWLRLQDTKYFRLVEINRVLFITFEKHRYRWRDYLEELQDALWVVL